MFQLAHFLCKFMRSFACMWEFLGILKLVDSLKALRMLVQTVQSGNNETWVWHPYEHYRNVPRSGKIWVCNIYTRNNLACIHLPEEIFLPWSHPAPIRLSPQFRPKMLTAFPDSCIIAFGSPSWNFGSPSYKGNTRGSINIPPSF